MRKYRKVDEKGWKEGRGVQNHQHEHEHKKKLKRNLLKGRLRRRMNFKGHIFKLPKSTQSHITVAKEASMDIFSLYLSQPANNALFLEGLHNGYCSSQVSTYP